MKKFFYIIGGLWAIPGILLLLSFTGDTKYWVIFLLSLLPIGILASVTSLTLGIKSFKKHHQHYVGLSFIAFILSGIMLGCGILSDMLVYAVLDGNF